MDFDNKTLAQYLVEVKRIEESRSKGADKEIRSLYKALLKNLNSFIGEYYTKYSNDEGILNVAILQQSAKYASFLEEVDKNIKEVTYPVETSVCFEAEIEAGEYTGAINEVALIDEEEETAAKMRLLTSKGVDAESGAIFKLTVEF